MLLRAIISIQMNFCEVFFPNFRIDKMTLCNNDDQTWFSDALTSARPLGDRKTPRISGSGFNTTLGVQQMLIHRKKGLIPIVVNRFYCMAIFHSQTRRHMINDFKAEQMLFHSDASKYQHKFKCCLQS